MRIVSVSENYNIERRVAITPGIANKYIALGIDVSISKNYATHLGIDDSQYLDVGVTVSEDENQIINSADTIVQLGLPSNDKSSLIKENQTLIEF